MKASIVFYPNELKKSQKILKTPIYMRVCMRGKKSETRLNAELNEEQVLKWDPMTMRLSERGSNQSTAKPTGSKISGIHYSECNQPAKL